MIHISSGNSLLHVALFCSTADGSRYDITRITGDNTTCFCLNHCLISGRFTAALVALHCLPRCGQRAGFPSPPSDGIPGVTSPEALRRVLGASEAHPVGSKLEGRYPSSRRHESPGFSAALNQNDNGTGYDGRNRDTWQTATHDH